MISNELLKKKILDEAIHGRLIENDPSLKPLDVPSIDKDIPFEIPNNWKWSRLTNIFEVKGGKRIPKGDTFSEVGNHVYIRVADMENMTINTKKLKYIDEEVFDKIKNYIITDKDLYITVAGTIGQVGSVPKELNGMNLTENANRLIPKNVNKEYYKYILNGKFMQNSIKESTTKAAQPKLAIKRINDLIVPVPPLEEQEKIVTKIEELFELVDKKEKNDKEKDKLKTLLKEKILDTEFKNIEEKYLVKIEKISSIVSKGTTPRGGNVAYKEEGVLFIRAENIKSISLDISNPKYIDEKTHNDFLKRSILLENDILVSIAGALGRTSFVSKDNLPCNCNQAVSFIRIRDDICFDPKYIAYYISSKNVQEVLLSKIKKTAQPNLTLEHIKKIEIKLPPLEQQKKIVEKIEKCFELIEQL